MRKVFAALVALVLILALGGCAAAPEEMAVRLEDGEDTVTVTGSAGIEVKPDMARVTVGVVSTGSTSEAAREANAQAMTDTQAALMELGVAEEDMKTSDISLRPTYSYTSGYSEGTINGYRMSTSLVVTVRDLEQVGEVLDAAIGAGSNSLDSLDFLGETIVADSLTALTFYDPATGQPGAVQPDFNYGETELLYGSQTVTRPRYMSIGMAVDREEERIFLAYRLNTDGNHQLEVDGQILTQLPVRLAVIGADGRVLADLDTGMEVSPYGKFVFIPVEVQPEGERVAIRCPQEDKSVQVDLPA